MFNIEISSGAGIESCSAIAVAWMYVLIRLQLKVSLRTKTAEPP